MNCMRTCFRITRQGLDGVIVQDIGVVKFIRRTFS